MYKNTSVLIFVLLLAGCSAYSHVTNSTQQRNLGGIEESPRAQEAEEYRVYSALLAELYVRGNDTAVVVENQTTLEESLSGGGDIGRTLKYVSESMPDSGAQQILENFRDRNHQSQSLSCRFTLKVQCVLITKEEMDTLRQRGDFWNEFKNKYRGQGVISLSGVGFNHEANLALVYTGFQYGWKNGHGDYVLLIKQNNAWTIKHKVNVWVS